MRVLLALLAFLSTGHSAVNEVEVKVHGVLGDWGNNAIEVGRKVVVECAGQWREEITYSASFTKGALTSLTLLTSPQVVSTAST